MSEPKVITIFAERLDELEHCEAILTALRNGGVDNWEWYGDAMEEYHEWKAQRRIDRQQDER